MSYVTQRLDDDRIIAVTCNSDFDFVSDIPLLIEDLLVWIDYAQERVFIIADLRGVGDALNDLIQGANVVVQNLGQRLFSHPKVISVLTVINSASEQLAVPIFETMEEAIRYVREQGQNLQQAG
jgi:hypothetical protein